MGSFFGTKLGLTLFIAVVAAGCSDDSPVEELARKLPVMMKFTGHAEGVVEGVSINCLCDLNLELAKFSVLNGGDQHFGGTLGGEITRSVTKDGGDGFSFTPFLYGDVSVKVKQNDSLFLSWPGNLGTGIEFYDEIAMFKGILNRTDGSVSGTWNCAPLDLDEGGYVDMVGTVEGEWTLDKFD